MFDSLKTLALYFRLKWDLVCPGLDLALTPLVAVSALTWLDLTFANTCFKKTVIQEKEPAHSSNNDLQ